MSRPLCWSFSIVKKLELWSACFGRYCRNWLSFTALKTYSWHLKMVYCQLDILVKMVSSKVTTIENEHFNFNNFNICSWSYLELPWLLASDIPSHKQVNLTQMLTKCQVDVMWCNSWPPGASTGLSGGMSDDRSAWPEGLTNVKVTWPKGWPNVKLTWYTTTHAH